MTLFPSSARIALAAGLLVFAARPAAAQTQPPGQKSVPATKVFRYLDKFLKVRPADRSKIRVLFYLQHNGRSAYGFHPVLVDGDSRTPLPLAPDGHFERLPTLEQLLHKPTLTIDAPASAQFNNVIDIQAAVKPAQDIDAAEVVTAIHQVNLVMRETVGALAILAPAIRASFPGGGPGVAISASGAQTPLPMGPDGAAIYDPGAQRGVVRLHFARVPLKVDLVPAK